MFLELAEALDCPACRDGAGLVAFVQRAEGRRVLAGRLGCPLCEIEFPIEAGTIRFGTESQPPETGTGGPGRDAGEPGPAGEAVRVAALLGAGERDGIVVLLGPGLGRHGADVARLARRAEVLAWLDPDAPPGSFATEDLEAGVDPIAGASAAAWPVRSRFLDGVALRGEAEAHLDEAARCLKAGGRLVLVDRGTDDPAPEAGFRELARDETTWVGERA